MIEDMEIRTYIGNQLRTIRKKRSVTQETLANVLEVKRETISMWENGVNCMDAETIVKLCEYFQVTPDYFLSIPKTYNDEFIMKLFSITNGFSERKKENFLSLSVELADADLTDFQFLLIKNYIGMISQLSEVDKDIFLYTQSEVDKMNEESYEAGKDQAEYAAIERTADWDDLN